MKILWIFPFKLNCGISIYSRNYICELVGKCEIICKDPHDWLYNKKSIIKEINEVDAVHIQYETSFFMHKGADFFPDLVSKINKPLIVSLHEVYDEFPDVYPKKKISGNRILIPLKRIVYDFRHPIQSAFVKHSKMNFRADVILVHQNYQKKILIEKGIEPDKVNTMPFPVKRSNQNTGLVWKKKQVLRLGATGFINPAYDYELLLLTLEKLDIDWKFTWIGGLRNNDQKQILDNLENMIIKKNWEKKFIISGWVSEGEQNELLSEIDIYLALFKYRSSSASLATAIGAIRPIIATPIPLTVDINSSWQKDVGPFLISDNEPVKIIESIKKILNDDKYRDGLLQNASEYAEQNSFNNMAESMISLYKRLTK